MMLPRIAYAVPKTLATRFEIVRAIGLLTKEDEAERLQIQTNAEATEDVGEIAKEIARNICRELRRASFRPDQPRWPRGSGDIGGRWSGGAGEEPQAAPKPPPGDLSPTSWSVGENQKPPTDDPPKIPQEQPASISDFAKAAARWLAQAGLRRALVAGLEVGLEATVGGPVGDFLVAMEAASWLSQYLPYIYAYLDAPKTWEELQQNRGTGYDRHHVVERWSENDGIPRDMIYSSENEAPIPTLKHWEINGWLDQKNDDFRDLQGNILSPRQYLRGKSWEERYKFGIDVLIRFKVLKP